MIRSRLGSLKARGVTMKKGQTLRGLYDERIRLYERYADIVIEENGLSTRQTVEAVVRALGEEESE